MLVTQLKNIAKRSLNWAHPRCIEELFEGLRSFATFHSKEKLGKWGEKKAAQLISYQGYQIWKRNWTGEKGELDIIASYGSTLIICEVKTREQSAGGYETDPLQNITRKKERALLRTTSEFQRAHRVEIRKRKLHHTRCDAVAITACRTLLGYRLKSYALYQDILG